MSETLRSLELEAEQKRFSFSIRDEFETKLLEVVPVLENGEHVPARTVESELRRMSSKRRKMTQT